MDCSLCNANEATSNASDERMRDAVRNGFNPFRIKGLISEYILGLISPGYPRRWAESILDPNRPAREWPLCDRCLEHLERYRT